MSFDIYQGPMVAERPMAPNVIYIHDDSGSMSSDHMPDEAPGGRNLRHSAFLNKQYYNPDTTYQPPLTYKDGKLVSWGNMDERCVWPKVMRDGFTGTPGVCGATDTLNADSAVYYDYIPGFNSRIDNQFNYVWDPIVMVDGKMILDKAKAPENNPLNYEHYAWIPIPSKAQIRDNADKHNPKTRDVSRGMIMDRACPVLFRDVPESRAYYNNFAGAPGLPGNPHATCRYSYRTGEVDFESNYQGYSSTGPYAGARVAGIEHGRRWCNRDSHHSNFTGNAIGRSCVMGKHVIGDTTGQGTTNGKGNTLQAASDAEVWNYTRYAGHLKPNHADRKDHSLEHRVSKFVANGGSLLPAENAPRARTAREEIRNFANWYSYYRKRSMAAKSGASLAFANLVNRDDTTQPGSMMRGKVVRLGYDTINRIRSDGPGQRKGDVKTVGRGVVPFIDHDPHYPGQKFVRDFYDWVNALPTSGGTNLAHALGYTGKYLANANKNPWKEYPPDTYKGTGSGETFGCRRSFAILMTDGYSGDWGQSPANGDVDGTNGPVIWKTDKDGNNLDNDLKNRYQYKPESPFFGQFAGNKVSGSLADVAMYYWNHDLQPGRVADGGMANLLAPTKKNPAFWQHMQTFTIGLGVVGRMSDTEVNNFLASGSKKNILWTFPTGLDTNYERIDDLMHAGLNGHGGTSAAEDAGEFVGKLTALLTEIAGQDGSNTSPAVPRQLTTDTMLYDANYSPSDWTGDVLGYEVCIKSDGTCGSKFASVIHPAKWSAGELLVKRVKDSGHATRKIFTYDNGSAVAFDRHVSNAVKSAIDVNLNHSAGMPKPENCPLARPNLGNPPVGDHCLLHKGRPEQTLYTVDLLINYLRGDPQYEDTTTGASENYNGFRRRSYTDTNGNQQVKLLGDIINSSPDLITARNDKWHLATRLGYSTNPAIPTSGDAATYKTRLKISRNADGTVNTARREQTLLVGAGDGMLHGFDALTGQESFAYIPSAVHGILKKLADPQYGQIDTLSHSLYVDGSTVDADILLNGYWQTVAVGSTGRSNGGKGSYFALNVEKPSTFNEYDVLWEFTHDKLGAPANGTARIALLEDGGFYAIFGNGYNSQRQEASLFVVELKPGASYEVIDTGEGNANGLGRPALVGLGDGTSVLAYAGDLRGNVWKFDLVAKTAHKLLEATDPNGKAQPITGAPRIVITNEGDIQVIVGTGKFLEQKDVDNTDVQTVYSVRDKCGVTVGCTPPVATRPALQQLRYATGLTLDTYKDSNGNTGSMFGWKIEALANKLDYKTTQGFFVDLNASGMRGLRSIDKASEGLNMNGGNILIPLLVPSIDPCASAIEGVFMELDPFNGAPKKSRLYSTLNGLNVYKTGETGLAASISGGSGSIGHNDAELSGRVNDPSDPKKKCVWMKNPETGVFECIPISGGHKMGRQSWRQLR
ncbi:MAG: hypothetical protein LBU53_08995 [Zoogloeaceae bacterium]|nr:hypothetical protein [Zoogloeaceae bacterium]